MDYKIIKNFGHVAVRGDGKVTYDLKYVSWGKEKPQFELRQWKGEVSIPDSEVIMSKEDLISLRNSLNAYFEKKAEIDNKLNEIESLEQEKVKKKAGRPKKSSTSQEVKSKVNKPTLPKNVIEFPKKRDEYVKKKVSEKHTFEEAQKILTAYKEKYPDFDTNFVIDGLIEMCRANQNFCNIICTTDKKWDDVYKYYEEMARNGYAYNYNGIKNIDQTLALAYAIEFFEKEG